MVQVILAYWSTLSFKNHQLCAEWRQTAFSLEMDVEEQAFLLEGAEALFP